MGTTKQTWILGGKNIDEDPLFSHYYLSDSANTYGQVRAFYRGFTEAYYIPADAAATLAEQYIAKLYKNPAWMYKNLKNAAAVLLDIEAFVDRHPVADIQHMKLADVAALYRQQARLTKRLYTFSRIPQALDRGDDLFTSRLIAELAQLAGDKAVPAFACLTAPLGISRFEEAELRENEIANQFLAGSTKLATPILMAATPKQIQFVRELAATYGHIAYHGYGTRTVLGANEFWNRMQCKVDGAQPLPTLASTRKKRAALYARQRRLIRQLGVNEHLQALLKLYGEISIAKINRRFTQIKNFVLLDAILSRVSELRAIREADLRFMSQAELHKVLQGGVPNVAAISKRRAASVWVYSPNSIRITHSPAAYKRLAANTKPPETPRSTLAGTVVSVPNRDIQGRARIVFRAKDSFSPGDILVSEATDPDLIGHIRTAAAVLTEQGGVTSHASILARELEIPCIVGVANLLCSVQENDVLQINTKTGVVTNLGQVQSNVVNLASIASATPQDFGGKGYGLWKLHNIGLGSYLPQTYLVRPAFSPGNKADLQSLALICSAMNCQKLAIRSSSMLEDSNSKSWAGQFPTYLHVCSDAAQVQEKLTQLITWKPATHYASGGTLPGEAPMGAVVQEQIDSLYSGVCFTKCPVQNDASKVVIEVVEGMGDSLVSGKNIPVRIVYCKNKAEFTEFLPEGYHPAINQALLNLIAAALKADRHWAKPVDIEFAIDKQYQLRLLQCRPITS